MLYNNDNNVGEIPFFIIITIVGLQLATTTSVELNGQM